MRLAMLSYRLPVVGEKRGGVDVVAHQLADGLARRGHQVTVWSYDPRPEGAAYEVRALPWKRFAQTPIGLRLLLGYLGNIVNCQPRYQADAILATGDSLLLPLRRQPSLRIMAGSALGEALSARNPVRVVSQLLIYLEELLTAATQPCVGISRNARRWNPLLRRVIPLGVDLDRFRPAPELKTPYPSILFVGTLRGRKRGRLLLQWFARHIQTRFPQAQLTMVATTGPPMQGVTYCTGIAEAELVRLFQQSWVYASPSVYEGFGLPYLEAMACGTAVVASPNPGSRELLLPDCGILARDSDFAAELCRLLVDPAARAALERRALERARQYSFTTTLDQYESLLRELIGSSTKTRL